jgi:hypothetical protein
LGREQRQILRSGKHLDAASARPRRARAMPARRPNVATNPAASGSSYARHGSRSRRQAPTARREPAPRSRPWAQDPIATLRALSWSIHPEEMPMLLVPATRATPRRLTQARSGSGGASVLSSTPDQSAPQMALSRRLNEQFLGQSCLTGNHMSQTSDVNYKAHLAPTASLTKNQLQSLDPYRSPRVLC